MDRFSVAWSEAAVRSLERIKLGAPADARKILAAVERLESSPFADGKRIKKLKGYADLFRLRIGDFRVVFRMVGRAVQVAEVLRKPEFQKTY